MSYSPHPISHTPFRIFPEFWSTRYRTSGFVGMRQKLDHEMAFLKRLWDNNELTWDRETLDSLVKLYEPAACDAVLQKQGDLQGKTEDFDPGINMSDEDGSDSGSEADDADVVSPPAVPVDGDGPPPHATEIEVPSPGNLFPDTALAVPQRLSPFLEERATALELQVDTLRRDVDVLKERGQIVAASKIHMERKKLQRRIGEISAEDVAVAESFRRRVAQEQNTVAMERSPAESLTRTVAAKKKAERELNDAQQKAAKARKVLDERKEEYRTSGCPPTGQRANFEFF